MKLPVSVLEVETFSKRTNPRLFQVVSSCMVRKLQDEYALQFAADEIAPVLVCDTSVAFHSDPVTNFCFGKLGPPLGFFWLCYPLRGRQVFQSERI